MIFSNLTVTKKITFKSKFTEYCSNIYPTVGEVPESGLALVALSAVDSFLTTQTLSRLFVAPENEDFLIY